MEAVSKMRMLQRMSVLEEKGATFSHMKLRDIKVMGEARVWVMLCERMVYGFIEQ